MTKGYYSLIQYCPDFSRAEAANVGLVLFQADIAKIAVRVLENVRPALRRLGPVGTEASVLRDVKAMHYRVQHANFQSIDEFEKFVRTRGNKLQLTAPRPLRIEMITKDIDRMFSELVEPMQHAEPASATVHEQLPLLRQTFERLVLHAPDRAWINQEFHHRELGITIPSDYAYRNGCLNLVQMMPPAKTSGAIRLNAFGMSREGELVGQLEEGEGKLYVVSAASTPREREHEQEFADILNKVGKATFIASDESDEFAQTVEASSLSTSSRGH